MTDLTVANTIRDQIGGRALTMMGAYHLAGSEDSLTFKFKGCRKLNTLKVTLDKATDTYRVQFGKLRKLNHDWVREFDGVYVDMLHELIESETGLALSL